MNGFQDYEDRLQWEMLNQLYTQLILFQMVFKGECQMTKVHTYDAINWTNDFGVETNSFIALLELNTNIVVVF